MKHSHMEDRGESNNTTIKIEIAPEIQLEKNRKNLVVVGMMHVDLNSDEQSKSLKIF